MAETFKKRTLQQRRARRRQEKIERRQQRRAEEAESYDEMIVYIDEFGNFTDVPPSEQKREKVKAENIDIGIGGIAEQTEFKGTITMFLSDKGYGFIREEDTGDSVFFHVNNANQPVAERDRVIYEKERTPKGYAAIRIRKIG